MLKSLWPTHLAGDHAYVTATAGYVTVNVADGVNVWLRFLSITFIFRVYCPGSMLCSGSSFSITTCDAPPVTVLIASVYSKTFSPEPVLVITYSTLPSGFLVFSSGSKLYSWR